MPTLHFTVDSALLRELGERLVGKPYIALAELVKNSYDADATKATIDLDLKKDHIAVHDNGHGMELTEFKDFWMRIGSTHKEHQRSRGLKRLLTGSKGVGRLAVQFLASKLTLQTVSEKDTKRRLRAEVNWKKAVEAGDLTEATVQYEIEISEKGFSQGTSIHLTELNHKWDSDVIQGLAKEIWWLQPPFRSQPLHESFNSFEIELMSTEKEYMETFNWQMRAILDIWHARLVGKSVDGEVNLSLEFAGDDPIVQKYFIPDCQLRGGDFEIRIYHLAHRQPRGIRVGEARQYLRDYGGIHVYDGGFHLPFYGTTDNDWLHIEQDHSHRLAMSQFLPKTLRVSEGMTFLPTLSRVFGVVNVNTSREPKLEILITRDRLEDNKAFRNLVYMVRWATDFYANEEAKRSAKRQDLAKEIKPIKEKFGKVEDVLEKYRSEIPKNVYGGFHKDIQEAIDATETEAEATIKQIGLLGSLATAGISSLAYQHELKKQFSAIDDMVEKIGKITVKDENVRVALNELKEDMSSWVERARASNSLFAYLADTENVEMKQRFPAKKVVGEIKEQINVLARAVRIEIGRIDDALLLPKASLVEWSSIFQNVFINAFNAVMDSQKKFVDVSSRAKDDHQEILVQDTGCGVDLKEAEVLFRPFERRVKISAERRALGYGGTGLGLTIVDLIAKNIGCRVSFVEPEKGFATAFSLAWKEVE